MKRQQGEKARKNKGERGERHGRSGDRLTSEPAGPGEGPSAPLRTPALREGRSSRAAEQAG